MGVDQVGGRCMRGEVSRPENSVSTTVGEPHRIADVLVDGEISLWDSQNGCDQPLRQLSYTDYKVAGVAA